MLAAAVLGVPVQFLVQSKGLSLTTVSHASLMVGTLPMLLAIAAVVFAGERLHLGGWLAVASSTLGAALIALSSKEASGPAYASMRGNLLIVLSMFAAIGWILISKRLMRRHSAVMVSYHLLGRYCPAGGCGHDHIGLPFRPLLAPSMDCHRGAGIVRYGGHHGFVELGTETSSGFSGWHFCNLRAAGRRVLGVSLLHERLGIMALAGVR